MLSVVEICLGGLPFFRAKSRGWTRCGAVLGIFSCSESTSIYLREERGDGAQFRVADSSRILLSFCLQEKVVDCDIVFKRGVNKPDLTLAAISH